MLDEYVRRYEQAADFVAEGLAVRIVEEALSLMAKQGLSRADLARAMGVKPSYVSRILKAPPNMTLETIARLAIALGARPGALLTSACTPDAATVLTGGKASPPGR